MRLHSLVKINIRVFVKILLLEKRNSKKCNVWQFSHLKG